MYFFRTVLLLSVTLMLSCSPGKKEVHSKSPVSDILKRCIQRDFASSTLFQETDYDISVVEAIPSDQAHWTCSGDFNGDGIADQAVLLHDANGASIVVAYLQRSGDFEKYILDTIAASSTKYNVALSICAKGSYAGAGETFVLQNAGIDVHLLDESLTFTFFWSGNRFVRHLWD